MHIQVITGSVRKNRINLWLAKWLTAQIEKISGYTVELVDIKQWYLPMDDEAEIPAKHHYEQSHTQLWSQKISQADGFVFIFPQYNWGYPAALKNVLDHLYTEWANKPAGLVSYANRGGGKAADQLQQVLIGLHMQVAIQRIAIKLSEIDLSFIDFSQETLSDATLTAQMLQLNKALMSYEQEVSDMLSEMKK